MDKTEHTSQADESDDGGQNADNPFTTEDGSSEYDELHDSGESDDPDSSETPTIHRRFPERGSHGRPAE